MTEQKNKQDFNVLTLDGGGVRGLSSLIIFKVLMDSINEKVAAQRPCCPKLEPADVFDLVVGTSTGGLIALMLVKLRMSIDDCICIYKKLSEKIFSKWNFWGYLTGGFGSQKKFSSDHFRQVMIEEVIDPALKNLPYENLTQDLLLENNAHHGNFAAAVVCRRLHPETGRREPRPVFLCSHKRHEEGSMLRNHLCHQQRNKATTVKVSEAACATAAAPTYFSPIDLEELGMLVDGGYGETNNPSEATWFHYFLSMRQRTSTDGLVQIVNIGTGSECEAPTSSVRTKYIPKGIFGGMMHLVGDFKTLVTDSEAVGQKMRTLASCLDLGLVYDRFSANVGNIHGIQLHEYKKCLQIEALTEQYLSDKDVRRNLDTVADRLAATYIRRHPLESSLTPVVDTSAIPRRQASFASRSDFETPDSSNASSRSVTPLPRTPTLPSVKMAQRETGMVLKFVEV